MTVGGTKNNYGNNYDKIFGSEKSTKMVEIPRKIISGNELKDLKYAAYRAHLVLSTNEWNNKGDEKIANTAINILDEIVNCNDIYEK